MSFYFSRGIEILKNMEKKPSTPSLMVWKPKMLYKMLLERVIS